MADLITQIRTQLGDTDTESPNITDTEYALLLKNAAGEYSRIKSFIAVEEQSYSNTEEFYDTPSDCFKVKSVELKDAKRKLNFIDNLNQIILESVPDVQRDTLKITYFRYFSPEEIDERELDVYMLYCEALAYKLMASKTADYIKFSTGEKTVDESGLSEKYMDLFIKTNKIFRSKMVKAYGRRANNPDVNLNYDLPYPPLGETP